MPLIYVNCPEDTFTTEARDSLADEITTIIVRESGLKPTPSFATPRGSIFDLTQLTTSITEAHARGRK
ncbi:tautomerase family protein [Pseudomonas syringae]|uniref:tautomerase family protein n=1 Tax=Pseudomonas syringae TaxID=317 RepID=UPI003D15B90B